jgi:hypothetical protein
MRYFTTNPTKLVLHFSDFSMIFYAIYKKQESHFYYLSYSFAVRPSERSLVLQCGPWGRPARLRPNSGRGRRRGRSGKGAGRRRGALGPTWGVGLGGEAGGGGRRRRTQMVVMVELAPARCGRGRGLRRSGDLR